MNKKVLQICMSQGKGGMELYVGRIAEDLKDIGWEVYSVCLEGTRVAQYMDNIGVEKRELPSTFISIMKAKSILKWIKNNNISVVHCHKSSDLRLAIFLKMMARDLRIFFTDHVGGKSSKKDPYHRLAYGIVERVFSISDATYKRNVNNLPLPTERVSRLHHGIDVVKYAPYRDPGLREEKRRSLGVPEGSIAIGLPGRVTPGKGQDIWLKALARLPSDLPYRALSIGGTARSNGGVEEFHDELQAIVKAEGIQDRVDFLGHRNDLDEIVPALDIVCIPSRNEAFGLTVIESMAAGVAIIGSNAGSLPELLPDGFGILVGFDDIDGWAEAIEELLRDSELRESLGHAARERAVAHFSKERHVELLADYYLESKG